MKEVFKRFDKRLESVHFVSITVDPEKDTPQVLKQFMQDNDLNSSNWHCLTGSQKDIYNVVVENMRVHMGDKELKVAGNDTYDIPHLSQLALFDQNGDLRGLFKPITRDWPPWSARQISFWKNSRLATDYLPKNLSIRSQRVRLCCLRSTFMRSLSPDFLAIDRADSSLSFG